MTQEHFDLAVETNTCGAVIEVLEASQGIIEVSDLYQNYRDYAFTNWSFDDEYVAMQGLLPNNVKWCGFPLLENLAENEKNTQRQYIKDRWWKK